MQTGSDFFILKPFNTIFFFVSAIFFGALIITTLVVKDKDERTKKNVLLCACLLTFIGFIVYKYFLFIDADYDRIASVIGGFNWWGELPLHLCNVNMILIPIAVLLDNRPLKSFCFFVAPLAAGIAIIMPGIGFNGYSILLPRMIGYFGTHFMILIEGLALATFGLYKPKFNDFPMGILTTIILTFGSYCINMLLRLTHIYAYANYFYTVDTEGNFLLELFYKWIPCPFLYLFPGIAILAAYMIIVTSWFYVFDSTKHS